MNPKRRITHTAITENKHLSAVLAHIKAEQDKAAPKPKVKPVSAKNGYVKNGRSPGRPSKLELHYAAKRTAAAQTGSESRRWIIWPEGGYADFAAVCFAASARAAFPCERSTGLSAVQQFAPNLPLDRVTPDGIQNDISLRLAPTIKAVGLCSRWLRLHEWLL